jgi:hypothetical protein
MVMEGDAGQGDTTGAGGDVGAGAAATDTTSTGGAGDDAAGSSGDDPPAGDAAAAAYAANYKYKYVDPTGKDAEGEVDDLFKPLIKSADIEKKIRDLHEKGHSLDFIKSGRAKAQQEHTQVSGELAEIKGGLAELRQFVQAGDFDAFFERLQIPPQAVMQYALMKAQYEKMSPEQKQQYDMFVGNRRSVLQLQNQNQFLQQQHANVAVQARTQELATVLARPGITAMVSAYDSMVGNAGAFQAEVIRRGQHAAMTSGQDIPAEAIVADLMAHYKNLVTATAPAAQGTAPAIVQPSNKPALPNIAGKGTSPAKRVPKSIADLRKIGKQLAAAEA